MAKEEFAAFSSYVHQDDEHDGGRLTKIREWFEGEISAQTGEAFEIFQDREDIKWGNAWEERINGALDGCTFLIAVITPRFLKSAYCRKEFQRFTKREKELGRNDLILPLLYMDTQGLDDPDDKVAVAISSRQYADWRSLRFEPWTNPDVRKRLSELSKMVCDAMPRKTPQPKQKRIKAKEKESRIAEQVTEISRQKPASAIEPLTLIVDPMPHRGDFTKITDAVQAAEPGTRILIRPGLYKEAIILDKALELIGDGERDEVIVETMNNSVLLFKTEFGRVSNLTFRKTGGEGGELCSIKISQGRLELEDCNIISNKFTLSVGVFNGADPRLRRNQICNSLIGVSVQNNGKGTLENNDIVDNLIGVVAARGGYPTLRNNRICNSGTAIVLASNGGGIFEKNMLRKNKRSWDIDDSSKTNVSMNDNTEE